MKSQFLKKQLVAKMATGGSTGDDKGKKFTSREEALKNTKTVSSEKDIPKDAEKITNSDGSTTYLVKKKSIVPQTTNNSASVPAKKVSAKVVSSQYKKASKPAAQEEYEAVTLPAQKQPATVSVKKPDPGAAFGWIGNVRQEFNAPTIGKVNVGGKQVPIQTFTIPGQYDAKTKVWNSSTGWGNPTTVYGYQGPNGLVPVDLNNTATKESGLYDPNELAHWDPEMEQVQKNAYAVGSPLASGSTTQKEAELQQARKKYGNVDVKDATIERNLYEGLHGKTFGMDKPLNDSLKKNIVPTQTINTPVGGMKKGGLLGKYASGGPVINPQIKFDANKYYNQIQGSANSNVDSTVVPDPNTKKGLLGSLSSADKQSAGQMFDAAGTILGSSLDAVDRKDGRSSIAGQTGSGLLKGAGKGAALGMNPALIAATGGNSAWIAPIVGGVLGAGIGAARGEKERKGRQSDVTQDVAQNVSDMVNRPYDINNQSSYKSSIYNKKDFRNGIQGLFVKGGQVKGPGTGTSDDVEANIQSGSYVVPAKNADIAKKIRKHMLGKEEKAELNQKGGVKVKLSNGEHLFSPEEVKELTAAGINLDALAPEAKSKLRDEYMCGGKIPMGYAKGGHLSSAKAKVMLKEGIANGHKLTDKQKRYFGAVAGGDNKYADGGPVGVPDWASMYKKEFKKKPVATKKSGLLDSLKFTAPPVVPGENEDLIVPEPQSKTSKVINEPPKLPVPPANTGTQTPDYNPEQNQTTPADGRKYGLGDVVGLGLGTLQAGFGLQQLLKDKRPIGQIDPAFNSQVDQAITSSKYGYTPQQKALLQDQIVQNRINQTNAVNAMAGGNASVGLNNIRSAINNQVRNQLNMASEDEQLRLQKQQYASGLAMTRAGMRRQLFQDKMDKFMQNQQTGAMVLGSGISNIVNAQRYNQERLAQDQINKMMYQPVNITP